MKRSEELVYNALKDYITKLEAVVANAKVIVHEYNGRSLFKEGFVLQINIWKCESCGKLENTMVDTTPYSDPVVQLPREGWDYDWKDRLCCPECNEKPDEGKWGEEPV